MKQKSFCVLLIRIIVLCLSLTLCGAAFAEKDGENAQIYTVFTCEGTNGSVVSYPMLITDSIAADAINQKLMEEARIDEYVSLLGRLTEGGTGLKVTCDVVASNNVYSVLITAEGKMLSGPPAKVYYPMTFDLSTGEKLSFDALFTDAERAKTMIEDTLETQVEPRLSTYLENSSLFPVPYERFFLDGQGHITLCYEKSQLSFLSGDPGAVSFRYSELWDALNTDIGAPCMDVQLGEYAAQYAPTRKADFDRAKAQTAWCEKGCIAGISQAYVGQDLTALLERLRSANDSGYYPGGAYYETEHPALRGTLLLTDEQEEKVTGVLTDRVDSFGIETGKTPLREAVEMLGKPSAILNLDAETAESYLVCPGQAAIYAVFVKPEGEQVPIAASYTLYADPQGIVQYVKLAYTN